MPGKHGKDMSISFNSQTLNTDFRGFTSDETAELADDTAGSDANRHYIAGVKDGTATVTCVAQSGGTALWAAVAPGTSDTLQWSGAGGGTQSVEAIVQSRSNSVDYGDVAMFDVTFQFIGAVS